jgi:hypothetical protein
MVLQERIELWTSPLPSMCSRASGRRRTIILRARLRKASVAAFACRGSFGARAIRASGRSGQARRFTRTALSGSLCCSIASNVGWRKSHSDERAPSWGGDARGSVKRPGQWYAPRLRHKQSALLNKVDDECRPRRESPPWGCGRIGGSTPFWEVLGRRVMSKDVAPPQTGSHRIPK